MKIKIIVLIFGFLSALQDCYLFGMSDSSKSIHDSKKRLEDQFVKDREGAFEDDITDICTGEVDYFDRLENLNIPTVGCGLRNGTGMPCRSLLFLASLYGKEKYFCHLLTTIPDAFNDNDLSAAYFEGTSTIQSCIQSYINKSKADLQSKENRAPRPIKHEYASDSDKESDFEDDITEICTHKIDYFDDMEALQIPSCVDKSKADLQGKENRAPRPIKHEYASDKELKQANARIITQQQAVDSKATQENSQKASRKRKHDSPKP